MKKEYAPTRQSLLFRTWKKTRPADTVHQLASISKEEAKQAGRPIEFYVKKPVPNFTGCPCKVRYPIIQASLPAAWQRLARKAKKVDGVKSYFTCNCQGRVLKEGE